MKVKFISLASGSSGNCYYIGTEKYGILIDAGIAVRTIKKGLKEAGISMEMIRAVFVTHDHADHIKAVGDWVKNSIFLFIQPPGFMRASTGAIA